MGFTWCGGCRPGGASGRWSSIIGDYCRIVSEKRARARSSVQGPSGDTQVFVRLHPGDIAHIRLADVTPQAPRKEMRVLSPEEARAFLAAAADDRRSALFVLALSTGAREGECLALRWSAVDFAAGTAQSAPPSSARAATTGRSSRNRRRSARVV